MPQADHDGAGKAWLNYRGRSGDAPRRLISLAAPVGAVGDPGERLLWYVVVLIFTLSKGQGSCVDAEGCAVEAFVAGALACVAREARRREWARNPLAGESC